MKYNLHITGWSYVKYPCIEAGKNIMLKLDGNGSLID